MRTSSMERENETKRNEKEKAQLVYGKEKRRKERRRDEVTQAFRPFARLIIHDLGNARCAYGLVGLAYLA